MPIVPPTFLKISLTRDTTPSFRNFLYDSAILWGLIGLSSRYRSPRTIRRKSWKRAENGFRDQKCRKSPRGKSAISATSYYIHSRGWAPARRVHARSRKKKRRDTRHRAQLEDAPFPPPAIEHANAIIYYLVNRSLSSLRSCCNYFLLYEGMMGVLFHLSVCLCVYMCVCVWST